ncbi:tagatose-6-phosphate ketose/aldose isomerase [Williamsoniiplasma luminosum]|uniref:Tagatose-6-phosphate ketose/aldose isomerase n=1 Tax=Williamsoniiplasma luminosum TaxID=214888 RepID=A0A2K8NUJ5_9MOLU|nr:SIS domain-containing protein [Williamsoniiplasma luminosum]ATZ17515.1 tagatose-6-phosphate ketose/aldose isomerase [Williamsoniiplasma luminosum]
MILNFTEKELRENKGINTLTEILQQPQMWIQTSQIIQENAAEIQKFLQKNLHPTTKVILTGAGTSEFVGSSLVRDLIVQGIDAQVIPTTDIVSNIEEYVNPKTPTILISFARSGNSPESVATFKMMNQFVEKIQHIIITCNKDGALLQVATDQKNCLKIVLPEQTNDQSFAMTSSYSSMVVACLMVFNIFEFDRYVKRVEQLAVSVSLNIKTHYQEIAKLAQMQHERIVYLGSGNLNGIAQESHLKVLELTAGAKTAFYNTPLGFRHGPKSVLNQESIVFLFMNQDPYKRVYDLDLLKELSHQKQAKTLVVFDYKNNLETKALANFYFDCEFQEDSTALLGLNYIVLTQLYAFYKSLDNGKTPDNPWPSGLVNRVVAGVIIYEKEVLK